MEGKQEKDQGSKTKALKENSSKFIDKHSFKMQTAVFSSYSLIVLVLVERSGEPIRQISEGLPNLRGPFLLENGNISKITGLFPRARPVFTSPRGGRHCLC